MARRPACLRPPVRPGRGSTPALGQLQPTAGVEAACQGNFALWLVLMWAVQWPLGLSWGWESGPCTELGGICKLRGPILAGLPGGFTALKERRTPQLNACHAPLLPKACWAAQVSVNSERATDTTAVMLGVTAGQGQKGGRSPFGSLCCPLRLSRCSSGRQNSNHDTHGQSSALTQSQTQQLQFPLSCVAIKGPGEARGAKPWLTRLARNVEVLHRRDERAASNGTRDGKREEHATQYAVLAIVPVFCVMGLLGILFCNLLKKKGYHCTAHKESDEEVAKAERGGNNSAYRIEDANQDTIGVLVQLITEKKENAAALEELLKEYHSKQVVQTSHKPATSRLHFLPHIPHICRHQHHLHTVQGLATRSGPSCTRCCQKKWPEVLLSPEAAATAAAAAIPTPAPKPAKLGGKASRPGEITILSVGRFRVACIPEQKPNPPEVKTILECSGAEPADSPRSGLPAEQKSLVGNGARSKWLKTADSQQEVII
ncbi:hypothetical protein KIL84_019729 [Mauremys mutica]|uniref:RELT TNF receptor n=1 Tax=Mauremys mutica TaxID=74926 RepID=A0A9D3XXB8_9SAUR|nr:hypothetical protein KIL84_019729 [Mauremys mutica]